MFLNGKKGISPYVTMISYLVLIGTIGVFRRMIPLSSAALAFFRGLIGSFSVALYALLSKKQMGSRPDSRTFIFLLISGSFIGINWILLFEAYNYTTISQAALAYYMQPAIVLMLSPALFKEQLTRRKVLCAFLSLTGMFLISGISHPGETTSSDMRGIILGLCAACFYAGVVILNKLIIAENPWYKTIIQLSSAAVVLVPYLLFTNGFSMPGMNLRLLLFLCIIGTVYTGFAYVLYFSSIPRLKAQSTALLSYIDPVTAVLISSVFLGEKLSPADLIGALLIIGSALFSEYH